MENISFIVRNCVYNTEPFIVHCPGMKYQINKAGRDLLHDLASRSLIIDDPKRIAIVTWNTEDSSFLERQCKKIDVVGRGIKQWQNGLKGPLLFEYARSCEKEFICALDAKDVVIVKNIDGIERILEERHCECVFGAEHFSYPPDKLSKEFEEAKYRKPFCHLNSGMIIAKTKFLRECENINEDVDEDWYFCDDQKIWKDIHISEYPRIQIDDGCCVFQNVNIPDPKSVSLHEWVILEEGS